MSDNSLSTLPSCPACDAEDWQFLPEHTEQWKIQSPGRLFKCSRCGLLTVYPQPAIAISEEIFNDSAYYRNVVGKKDAFFRERLSLIKQVAEPHQKKLLDVGCALGDLLEIAITQGFDAEGIEFSEYACKYAQEIRGLQVSTRSVDQLPDDTYDIVHANHVLEHIYAPLSFMMHLRRILKPGGHCIIEVPNEFDNLMTRLNLRLGRAWGRPIPSIHLFFFNPCALELLAVRAGFANVKVSTWTPRVVQQDKWASNSPGRIARNFLRTLADKTRQGTNIVLICRNS